MKSSILRKNDQIKFKFWRCVDKCTTKIDNFSRDMAYKYSQNLHLSCNKRGHCYTLLNLCRAYKWSGNMKAKSSVPRRRLDIITCASSKTGQNGGTPRSSLTWCYDSDACVETVVRNVVVCREERVLYHVTWLLNDMDAALFAWPWRIK